MKTAGRLFLYINQHCQMMTETMSQILQGLALFFRPARFVLTRRTAVRFSHSSPCLKNNYVAIVSELFKAQRFLIRNRSAVFCFCHIKYRQIFRLIIDFQ